MHAPSKHCLALVAAQGPPPTAAAHGMHVCTYACGKRRRRPRRVSRLAPMHNAPSMHTQPAAPTTHPFAARPQHTACPPVWGTCTITGGVCICLGMPWLAPFRGAGLGGCACMPPPRPHTSYSRMPYTLHLAITVCTCALSWWSLSNTSAAPWKTCAMRAAGPYQPHT